MLCVVRRAAAAVVEARARVALAGVRHASSSEAQSQPQSGASASASGARRVRIYTRTGDGGQSSLFTGERRSKGDRVFEALGCLDELNAAIGLLNVHLPATDDDNVREQARAALREVQSRLLDVGAYVATPRGSAQSSVERERRTEFAANALDLLEREHAQALTRGVGGVPASKCSTPASAGDTLTIGGDDGARRIDWEVRNDDDATLDDYVSLALASARESVRCMAEVVPSPDSDVALSYVRRVSTLLEQLHASCSAVDTRTIPAPETKTDADAADVLAALDAYDEATTDYDDALMMCARVQSALQSAHANAERVMLLRALCEPPRLAFISACGGDLLAVVATHASALSSSSSSSSSPADDAESVCALQLIEHIAAHAGARDLYLPLMQAIGTADADMLTRRTLVGALQSVLLRVNRRHLFVPEALAKLALVHASMNAPIADADDADEDGDDEGGDSDRAQQPAGEPSERSAAAMRAWMARKREASLFLSPVLDLVRALGAEPRTLLQSDADAKVQRACIGFVLYATESLFLDGAVLQSNAFAGLVSLLDTLTQGDVGAVLEAPLALGAERAAPPPRGDDAGSDSSSSGGDSVASAPSLDRWSPTGVSVMHLLAHLGIGVADERWAPVLARRTVLLHSLQAAGVLMDSAASVGHASEYAVDLVHCATSVALASQMAPLEPADVKAFDVLRIIEGLIAFMAACGPRMATDARARALFKTASGSLDALVRLCSESAAFGALLHVAQRCPFEAPVSWALGTARKHVQAQRGSSSAPDALAFDAPAALLFLQAALDRFAPGDADRNSDDEDDNDGARLGGQVAVLRDAALLGVAIVRGPATAAQHALRTCEPMLARWASVRAWARGVLARARAAGDCVLAPLVEMNLAQLDDDIGRLLPA